MQSTLDRLFRPQSIAIVGASASPEKAGHMAVKLLDSFSGEIYPVNRNEQEILGHQAYPSLTAIGKTVDLVVLAVPAPACPALLREASEIGAGAALVLGGGFAESGADGQKIQDEIVGICRETGIRLLGPNTGGFADPINKLVASFSISFRKIPPGSIAIVSQSGGMSLILACMLENDGFGVSLTAGLGNSINIDSADMIDYLAEDENTTVIMLYLEGLSDGRRLYEAVNRATRLKPVVALTIGRTDIGEFAKSHTGNLVGSYELKAAALKQAGAVVVDSSNDLIDAACAFSIMRLKAAADPAIGMLVGQAGAGLLMLDQLKLAGVNVPELSEQCISRISEHMPAMHYISNPVDTGRRSQAEFANILRVLNEDDELDAILAYGLYEPTALDPVRLFKELDFQLEKPVMYGTAGETLDVQTACKELAEIGVVPFKSPERSAGAMQAIVDDAKSQHRKSVYADELIRGVETGSLPAGALDEGQAKQIMGQIGVSVPKFFVCHNHDEALSAFAELNKPLAAKVLNADIMHKTEVSGVHLNIVDEEQLKAALGKIDNIESDSQLTYLIEEMAAPGLDLIVGGLRDPIFGPTVMLGMGGTMAELLKDVSLRLAPLHRADVEEMIGELESHALFDGWRGSPAIDRQAVIDTVIAVSNLLVENDQIKELDINPLRAYDTGVLALDALIVRS